jgi:Fe2+ transport system protein FeoA
VEILRCAPSGDPIEISVMGYALSLRRAEANLILVSPEPT